MSLTAGDVKSQLDEAGYFPALVGQTLELALGGEGVESLLTHTEPTMTSGTIGSHATVLALTPTRLIALHVDDYSGGPENEVTADATSEAVALRAIRSVTIGHVVAANAGLHSEGPERSVTLSISWGAVARIDLEPARCPDPRCEADHGYEGTFAADDVVLRFSAASDGARGIDQALAFAGALSAATARL
jgi:hypothetical protein